MRNKEERLKYVFWHFEFPYYCTMGLLFLLMLLTCK